MIHLTVLLEDTTMIATLNKDQHFDVRIYDELSGKMIVKEWTGKEFAAVLALALGGDDSFDPPTTKELYAVAELAVANMPIELRPIP